MASNSDDDDLDEILDTALDAFDVNTGVSVEKGDAEASAERVGTEEEDAPQPAVDGAQANAIRAFEEVLRKLDVEDENNGAQQDKNTDAADLKLVEEFMKSLESQFEKMGVIPDGNTPGITNVTGREAAAGSSSTIAPSAPSDAATNFEKVVESMVGQLLSKEVLKGPMLQMRESFAKWLPANERKLEESERERYKMQQRIVIDICKEYEQGGDTSKVMELLTKMQESGAPPPEIMNELASDKDASDDADTQPAIPPELESLASQCPVQ